VLAPQVGATVLYTLGHNRAARHGGHAVCLAQVVAHNADGTLALWVHSEAPPHEFLRPWVPPARAPAGSSRAAGHWSPAPQA
jgi:hypothetical protein